ncbi:NAD(P)/FAD-dependent oxidoreductase [Conexibacter stalactiti]|uniref:NAD(P)/FAD-dependent oxidoreductase n=1 Tax=Conexibacter stalactiti TaxID=1940611 RepID=A0ABU4HYF5_9ACTN|nr:NAD(P)/FAD-dependent oxidoreductase [Conexibacter stalactiti]MDW5597094.1 NAD(P)/FAD-dependent oxidoreductase [Conexibacter stalactiti]MEC5037736.1 NAD(P)/FAD-dependent oxidoreductase [Conexibacter stalactiti]
MRAEIAGAGFAGLTLATALAQRGWSVRVHERAAQPRGGGAGIFLWENGLRTLAALGIEDEVLARSHSAAAWEERDHEGADIGRRPFPLPGGLRMVTMTRHDLYAPLLGAARAAGVELRTGSTVVGADPLGALLTRDARWPADVVIGADGINSRVRDALGLIRKRETFPELTIVRFTVPLASAPGHDGQWRNYVDHWNLADRRRVMFVPCNDDDLYLLLAARADDLAATARPLDSTVWCRSFPLLEPVLRELPDAPHADLYESIEVDAWSKGRVALAGDAAHAMPPTIGQGAGTAMTNALALALALDADAVATASGGATFDPRPALVGWEAAERPVTDATQATSVGRLANLFPTPGERRDSWGPRPLEAAGR